MVQNCKYYKEKKQVSYDNGITYIDVVPAEYRKGGLIEAESYDCGGGNPSGYSGNYLTFVAIDSGTFRFKGSSSSTVNNSSIEYSLDNGSTWFTLNRNVNSPTVQAGSRIMWKGTNLTPVEYNNGTVGIGYFKSTGKYNVQGNIMSLYYGDYFEDKTSLSGKKNAFYGLFQENYVVNANNLILPATTLDDSCYQSMFSGCDLLVTAPSLPATTMTEDCYNGMFWGCSGLTAAPELSATTLEKHCYSYMFAGCTSLTTAPELPATTLALGCYQHMFAGCSGLITAPVLSSTTLALGCYESMFQECTSLTTPPQLPATTLASNCYTYMFINCSSLTTAPQLSATTLEGNCYLAMFQGCTSLVTAPSILPATTLAGGCYAQMFEGCTSLTTAPELPATTFATGCYNAMFSGCTSLNYIKCLATQATSYHSYYTGNWVKGVSSTGTFVKDSTMTTWPTGDDGIPNNWTVLDAT